LRPTSQAEPIRKSPKGMEDVMAFFFGNQ